MGRILVVEDDEVVRCGVAETLRGAGHDVREHDTADGAISCLATESFDLVIADLRLGTRSGLDVLREVASRLPDCVRLVMTAYGSLEAALDAMRIGVHDFLLKPVNLDALRRKADLLMQAGARLDENRFLRKAVAGDLTGLIGASPAIDEVKRLIARVAPADSTLLVTGETGTGKEVVARAIHDAGPRRDQPFVAVNCGAIPGTLLESEIFGHVKGSFTGADRDKRGLIEVAAGGTVLLDEIGEMPLTLQPKLLRAIETREILRIGSTTPLKFGARIVASTHRNLAKMIQEGEFRSDLFYRLNVIEIHVPPLRERPGDVELIAQHLLERVCRRMGRPVPKVDDPARKAMAAYRWPGNVRELANVLERAVILTDEATIGVKDLPGLLQAAADEPAPDDLKAARTAFERAHIKRVLKRYNGDKQEAARALGIDVSSLYRKLST